MTCAWVLTGVDLALKERGLLVVGLFLDLTPPALRLAIRAVAPAVAARLQNILGVEGRADGVETQPCARGGRHQLAKGIGRVGARSMRQNLQEGMAVIDRAVAVVEPAALANEIAEL